MDKSTKILVRYGEISLKKKNQSRFVDALHTQIRNALSEFDSINIKKFHGRFFIDCLEKDKKEVFNRLSKVFGLISFSEVLESDLDMQEISKNAIKVMEKIVEDKGALTFKVESRRSNKGFPLKSPEISAKVGGDLLKHFNNIKSDTLKVDVHNPDLILEVEVRNKAYVFTSHIQALGGMPYGTSGKGLVLLSGGIDSPVALYMMAKRGLYVEAVHFHSHPYTSERAKEKVITLAEKLCEYTGELKIHFINIAKIQEAINENCPSEEMTVLSRRFMMRIASEIAEKNNLSCLVTGESLAQVASQTLEGMVVIENACKLPIFKPLIAFDKRDTVKISEQIDTFKTSILPYEDCCTVFLPDRVVTRPRLDKIKQSEKNLDIYSLLQIALQSQEIMKISRKKISDIEGEI